jgi:hypothetical protein
MMEAPAERKKNTAFIYMDNLNRYDLLECLDVLIYLQTFDNREQETEAFRNFQARLESRIDLLVHQKG